MENIPGVLLYKIIDFIELPSLFLIETMSTSIRNKLQSNLSAFEYRLLKEESSLTREDFSKSKK